MEENHRVLRKLWKINIKRSGLISVIKYEMESLHENHTFELVKLLKEKRALKNM